MNFYPNDQVGNGAPAPDPTVTEPPMPILGDAWIKAFDTSQDDHYTQAGALYRIMTENQKSQLVNNIAGGLIQAKQSVKIRMVALFKQVDDDYGARVSDAIGMK